MKNKFLGMIILAAAIAGCGQKKTEEQASTTQNSETEKSAKERYEEYKKSRAATAAKKEVTEKKEKPAPKKKAAEPKEAPAANAEAPKTEGQVFVVRINPNSPNTVATTQASTSAVTTTIPGVSLDSTRLAYYYQYGYDSGSSTQSTVIISDTPAVIESLSEVFKDLSKIENKYSIGKKVSAVEGAALEAIPGFDAEIRDGKLTLQVKSEMCTGNAEHTIVRADGKKIGFSVETSYLEQTATGCDAIGPFLTPGAFQMDYVLTEQALFLQVDGGFIPLIKR